MGGESSISLNRFALLKQFQLIRACTGDSVLNCCSFPVQTNNSLFPALLQNQQQISSLHASLPAYLYVFVSVHCCTVISTLLLQIWV